MNSKENNAFVRSAYSAYPGRLFPMSCLIEHARKYVGETREGCLLDRLGGAEPGKVGCDHEVVYREWADHVPERIRRAWKTVNP